MKFKKGDRVRYHGKDMGCKECIGRLATVVAAPSDTGSIRVVFDHIRREGNYLTCNFESAPVFTPFEQSVQDYITEAYKELGL